MAATELWSTIRSEREALAADLAPLTDDQWATPSLCGQWSVRDVLAHLTATAKITPPKFFGKLVLAGFRLERLQNKDIARERGPSPAATLAGFRAQVGSRKHPPGPTESWLGEVIVHGEDIRRPLGLRHAYPLAAVATVADSYKRSNLIIGTKKRIAGLRLQATDTDWSHGDGPEVRGPIVSLLIAMTGRQAGLADLSGDGVALFRQRS
jgi:uncharacterized protein (TIGR03083 family)